MVKKIDSFEEVLNYLSNKEIVTLSNGNYFVKRKDKIISYSKGNRIVMNLDDFKELYGKCDFFEYEDESVFIDFMKDQEYYSFKHK